MTSTDATPLPTYDSFAHMKADEAKRAAARVESLLRGLCVVLNANGGALLDALASTSEDAGPDVEAFRAWCMERGTGADQSQDAGA